MCVCNAVSIYLFVCLSVDVFIYLFAYLTICLSTAYEVYNCIVHISTFCWWMVPSCTEFDSQLYQIQLLYISSQIVKSNCLLQFPCNKNPLCTIQFYLILSAIYIYIFIYPIFCSNSQYQNLRVSEYEINFRYGIQWIASAFTYNSHGKIPTFSHLNVDFAAELLQATAKVREVEPEEARSGAEGI